ncbi:hypothetical protein U3516DRAFT_770695 [Neocallimastix sp. 'constans']
MKSTLYTKYVSSNNNFVIDNSNFENHKKSSFKTFLTNIVDFLINNVYDNNNNKLDIHTVEQYTKSYKNLTSYIFRINLIKNNNENLLENNSSFSIILVRNLEKFMYPSIIIEVSNRVLSSKVINLETPKLYNGYSLVILIINYINKVGVIIKPDKLTFNILRISVTGKGFSK